MKILKNVVFSLFVVMAATSASAGEPLRYFGQTETTYRSQTPYGNNEKQAAMLRQMMEQKFILNAMAKVLLLWSCMAD